MLKTPDSVVSDPANIVEGSNDYHVEANCIVYYFAQLNLRSDTERSYNLI